MVEQGSQTEITFIDVDFLQHQLPKQVELLQDQLNILITEKVNLQKRLSSKELTEDFFQGEDKRVKFYTGLQSFSDLMKVFNFIKDYISVTSKSSLTAFQHMMLTLMKLRHDFPLHDLAIRFGISTSTSSKIVIKLLNILYARIKWNVRWPSREELQLTMPLCFREHFGTKVAVIMDCFEVFFRSANKLTGTG